MHTNIEKIKEFKVTVTSSWAYSHKLLIVTLSLITVIAVQNYSYLLPSMPVNEVIAYNDRTEYVQCNYECLQRAYVILRTEQIHESMRGTARIMALQEMNDTLSTIITNE